MQFVEVRPQGRKYQRSYQVSTQSIPGPKKGSILENQPMEFILQPPEMADIWDVPRNNVRSHNSMTAQTGFSSINNSTKGGIVTSNFHFEVRLHYDTCCCYC